MSIEATADALVSETAMPIEAPADAPEMTEDAALDAVWDKFNSESPEEQPEDAPEPAKEAAEAPEADEAEAEAAEGEDGAEEAAEAVELPGNLPASLREHLAKMPKEAVDAVLTDREGLHRKLSEMGRQVQGIGPVRDILAQAVKSYPHLADMRPEQAGQEMLRMAEIGERLARDPVGTLYEQAKRLGAERGLAERLAGQAPSDQGQYVQKLTQHIQGLERKIAQLSDPNYLNERVSQVTTEQNVQSEVLAFSQQAEHWADVEDYLPTYIPVAQAKLGQGAAPSAVLKLAYEKAIQDFKPEAVQAPKADAVSDPIPAPDPEKTKAAVKAKSVNVTGKQTGRPRVLTEDEMLDQAYERAMRK